MGKKYDDFSMQEAMRQNVCYNICYAVRKGMVNYEDTGIVRFPRGAELYASVY